MVKNTVSQTNLIQFSGVVVSQDSLQPVPYCSIIDKKTKRGTTSDYFGYFSFVASKGDTINFSCIGYKKHLLSFLTHYQQISTRLFRFYSKILFYLKQPLYIHGHQKNNLPKLLLKLKFQMMTIKEP